MKTGKLYCSGRGTHKRRTLGRYTLDGETMTVVGQDGQVGVYSPSGGGQTALFRFKCPSCQRDMPFRSRNLWTFLTMDIAVSNRDLSRLAAILTQ